MKLKRLAALLLCAAVMLPLAACAKKPDSGTSRTSQTTDDTTVTPTKDGDTSITATDKGNKGAAAQDLMQGITKGKGAFKKPDSRFANVAASFALDLFKDEYKSGKNTLVSPLSVLTALAMTQNGAEGKTLSEMQKVLGGLDRDTLNAYMNAYLAAVAGKDSALKCANSIWVGSKLDVKRAFLQKNADFYSAQAYKADFTSTRTVKEINSWVSKNTNGMIKKLVDEFDPLTVMVLMNALCLEAEWDDPYTDNCVLCQILYGRQVCLCRAFAERGHEHRQLYRLADGKGLSRCAEFEKEYSGQHADAEVQVRIQQLARQHSQENGHGYRV